MQYSSLTRYKFANLCSGYGIVLICKSGSLRKKSGSWRYSCKQV